MGDESKAHERSLPDKVPSQWFLDKGKMIFGGNEFYQNGMCFGYAEMASQAIVNRNLAAFNDHLAWLYYGPPRPMNPDYALTENKKNELVTIVKDILKNPTLLKNNQEDKFTNTFAGLEEKAVKWLYYGNPAAADQPISPEDLKSLIQIAKGIRAHYAKQFKNNASALEDFDQSNPHLSSLIDLQIFIENMAFYQRPYHFKELFDVKLRPLHQSASRSYSIMGLTALDAKSIGETSTRMTTMAEFFGLYTPEKLKIYFETLAKTIEDNERALIDELETKDKKLVELPFALNAGSNDHSVGFSFNIKTKKWIIINANQARSLEVKTEDMPTAFMKAFTFTKDTPSHIAISTRVKLDSASKSMARVLTDWQSMPSFKKIQELNALDEKGNEIQIGTKQEGPLLRMATIHGHMDAVKKLLATGANPNALLISTGKTLYQTVQAYAFTEAGNQSQSTTYRDIFKSITDYLYQQLSREIATKMADHNEAAAIDRVRLLLNDVHACACSYDLFAKAVAENNQQLTDLFLKAGIAEQQEVNTSAYSKRFPTSLSKAIHRNENKIVEMLINHGANFDARNQNGDTAFMIAAAHGQIDIIKLLLPKVTVTQINAVANSGRTGLCWAVSRGYGEMVKLLLDNGADPNAGNYKDGDTPLMIALEKNDLPMVRLLLDKYQYQASTLDLVNKQGMTPLFLATKLGATDIVKSLLEKGAKQTPCNVQGQMLKPIDIAEKNGNKDIVTMLKADQQMQERSKICANIKVSIAIHLPDKLQADKPFDRLISNLHDCATKNKDYDAMLYRYLVFRNLFAFAELFQQKLTSLPINSHSEEKARSDIINLINDAYTKTLTVSDKESAAQCIKEFETAIDKTPMTSAMRTACDTCKVKAAVDLTKILQQVIQGGLTDLVTPLLNLGANSSFTKYTGKSAFELAKEHGSEEMTSLLLAYERHLPDKARSQWFLEKAKVIVGEKNFDPLGMCHGYQELAGQAIINRNLAAFNEHLEWLYYGPTKPVAPDHVLSDNKKTELVAIVKDILKNPALIKDNKEDKFTNTFTDKEEKAVKWLYYGNPTTPDAPIAAEDLKSLIQISKGIRVHYANQFRNKAYEAAAAAFKKDISASEFKKMLQEAEHERALYYQYLREKYKDELKSSDTKTAEAKIAADMRAFDSLHTDIRQLLDIKEKINRDVVLQLQEFDKANPNLSSLIDVQIFLEDLAIYQNPDSFMQIFDETSAPINQSPTLVFPVIGLTALDVKSSEQTTTRLTTMAEFFGFYNLEKLKIYFETLAKAIENNEQALRDELETKNKELVELPFALSFISNYHAIGLSYNFKTKRWIVANANKTPFFEVKTEDMPAAMIKAFTFALDMPAVSQIEGFTRIKYDNASKSMARVLTDWQNMPAFKKIQEISALDDKGNEILTGDKKISLLYSAVRNGQLDAVKKLLATGANPNALISKDDHYKTPYQYAQSKAVDEILNQTKSHTYWNIFCAITDFLYQELSKKIADDIASSKEDVAINHVKLMLKGVHFCCYDLFAKAIEKNNQQVIDVFLKAGIADQYDVEPSVYTNLSPTVLCKAIVYNDIKVAKILIKHGVNFDYRNKVGDTAFVIAAAQGKIDFVKLMLPQLTPAQINAHNHRGKTGLSFAVSRGYAEVVKLLLDNGANPDAGFYNDGNTPLMAALKKNDLPMVRLLLDKYKKGSRTLDQVNDQGMTPLFLAAKLGATDIVKTLIAKGAKQTPCKIQDQMVKPIDIADKNGHKEIVDLLKANQKPQEHAEVCEFIKGNMSILMQNKKLTDKPFGRLIANLNDCATQDKDYQAMLNRYLAFKRIYAFANVFQHFIALLPAKNELEKQARTRIETIIDNAYSTALNITDEKMASQCISQFDKLIAAAYQEANACHFKMAQLFEPAKKDAAEATAKLFQQVITQGFSDLVPLLFNANASLIAYTGKTPAALAQESGRTEIAALIQAHELSDPLFKLKQDIQLLSLTSSSIRNDAIKSLKQLASDSTDYATLSAVYHAFQALDTYAAKLLNDRNIANGPVGKTFIHSFNKVLSAKNEVQANHSLAELRVEMSAIKTKLDTKLHSHFPIFRKSAKINLVKSLEEAFGKDVLPQVRRKN